MTYLVKGTTPVSIQAGGRYFWTGRRLGAGCCGHLYSGLEIKEHKEYHILAPRLTGNTQFSVFREQTLQTLLKERNVICVNQNWHKLIFCRHGKENWVRVLPAVRGFEKVTVELFVSLYGQPRRVNLALWSFVSVVLLAWFSLSALLVCNARFFHFAINCYSDITDLLFTWQLSGVFANVSTALQLVNDNRTLGNFTKIHQNEVGGG